MQDVPDSMGGAHPLLKCCSKEKVTDCTDEVGVVIGSNCILDPIGNRDDEGGFQQRQSYASLNA